MKQKIIIVGASQHAKVIVDIIEKEGKYQILGLLDQNKETGQELLGYKILGKEEMLSPLLNKNPEAEIFVAIGDNWMRKNVVQKIVSLVPGARFASAIHPSVQIAKDVTIGKGAAIMAGAVINSSTFVGDFTIINTKASIDHDGRMDDFSSLAPNATLGGNVTLGECSAISISATIKHGVKIGKHAIVGAGALLLNDCEDYSVMYGVPAKLIRSRQTGDKYL